MVAIKGSGQSVTLLVKLAVQAGWSLWITVVWSSNVLEALRNAGVLKGWNPPSGNFGLIRSFTAIYHFPDWINWMLFAGVLVWQALIVALFWRSSAILWGRRQSELSTIQAAYLVSIPLWFAFLVGDEVFFNWQFVPTHLGLLIAQVMTLLVLCLLPEVKPGTKM
jgi:hypothetical protein